MLKKEGGRGCSGDKTLSGSALYGSIGSNKDDIILSHTDIQGIRLAFGEEKGCKMLRQQVRACKDVTE